LTQDHATNLRDLILNYDLDEEDNKIIDFTYGKGGLWKTDYEYEFALTACDAAPLEYNETQYAVTKKNLLTDDYSDLGLFDAGVFDPPYKYSTEVFNYEKPVSMQKQGKNSWGNNPQFATNKNLAVFIDRLDALNRVALQCMKKESLLFVKMMDVRDGKLILNHVHVLKHLTNFECHAMFVYLAAGAHTWKHHAENSYGYWMVMRMTKEPKRNQLFS